MCDHAKERCVLHPAGCIPTYALCTEGCTFGNVTAQKRKHSNNNSNTALKATSVQLLPAAANASVSQQ